MTPYTCAIVVILAACAAAWTERPMSPVYFLFPWAAHKCPAGNKNFDKCAVNDAEHCPNAVGYCCHGVCLCVHSKIIFCPRLQKPHYFIGAH
uniref:Carboxypeptidase inhibitor n=1 Tax=Rhipicephalus zambeziensis TaxID=60191 RepID=A0A224YQV6_9ACAR